MRSQEREADLVRAGRSEIHRDIMSEEPFCVEIYRKKCTWTYEKSLFCGNLDEKRNRQRSQKAFCGCGGPTTFWMEVEAHVTRAILYGNLQEKCRTPIPGTAFFVEIYKKKAHGHVTRPIVSGNLQEKCRRLVSGPPLLSGNL